MCAQPQNGCPGYSYAWSCNPPDAAVNAATGQCINPSPSATTVYSVTVTDAINNTVTTTTTVTVNPLPNVTVSANKNLVCSGAPVTLTAKGANTYTWNTGQSGTPIVENPTSTTTYKVTGKDLNGCINSASTVITVDQPLIAINPNLTTICKNSSVTLTATAGFKSYLWNTGQSTSDITVSPQNATAYSVTGKDTLGCTNNASATINVNTLPTIKILQNDTTVCDITKVTLVATGGATYTWSTGQKGASIVVMPHVTTTYIVTGFSGCSNTDSVIINVNPLPKPDFTYSFTCSQTLTFFKYTGTPANVSAYWSFDDGNFSDSLNAVHYFIKNGTYTVILKTTDNHGCSDTSMKNVNIYPFLKVDFSSDTVCNGSNSTLTSRLITVGHIISQYEWKDIDNNKIIGNSAIIQYALPNAGTNLIQLKATDNNGCTDSVIHTVYVYTDPLADFIFNTVELGTPTNFTDETIKGSGNLSTWLWKFDDPNSGANNTSGNENPNHIFTATGTYNVTLIVTDKHGCIDSITKQVTVNKDLHSLFVIMPYHACQFTTVGFVNNSYIGFGTISNYLWNFGDKASGQLNTSNLQNPSHTYNYTGKFVVSLTVTGNGMTDTHTDTVTIYPSPMLDYTYNIVCFGDTTLFKGIILNNILVKSYYWDFGDFTNDTVQNPSHLYKTISAFIVRFSVTSDNGCSNSVSKQIVIYPLPIADFSVNNYPPDLQTSVLLVLLINPKLPPTVEV